MDQLLQNIMFEYSAKLIPYTEVTSTNRKLGTQDT